MAKVHVSIKKIQIDKSQATVVIIIAASIFVTIFSLFSAKALWTQRSYQARVINKKIKARDQLTDNIKASDALVVSYKTFVGAPTNIIGGNPAGSGDKDGDNARLILDALPSKYDFPALATSLEKIVLDKNFKVEGITGIDDELTQSKTAESSTPVVVDIPFNISVKGSSSGIQDLLSVFERSIRPFQTQKISLKGSDSTLQLTLDAKTFYQPEKALKIGKADVK